MEGHPHPGRLPSKPLGMTGTHQEAGRKAGGYPHIPKGTPQAVTWEGEENSLILWWIYQNLK